MLSFSKTLQMDVMCGAAVNVFTWLFLFCFETSAAVNSFMHGMLFI